MPTEKNKKKRVAQKWSSELDEPMLMFYEKNLDVQNRTIYFGAWQGNSPDDNGDISYFYYDLDKWKICGNNFSVKGD